MNFEAIATWSQVISAILFLVVLIWAWFRFIQPAVLVAQERSNKQIADAERHRDEAKASLGTLQSEIDGAKRDAAAIRQRASDQAAHEKTAIVAEARDAGERSVRNAQGELDRARAAARDRLRGDLAAKALELAKNDASARVDGNVNSQLVSQFLASLEKHGAN